MTRAVAVPAVTAALTLFAVPQATAQGPVPQLPPVAPHEVQVGVA